MKNNHRKKKYKKRMIRWFPLAKAKWDIFWGKKLLEGITQITYLLTKTKPWQVRSQFALKQQRQEKHHPALLHAVLVHRSTRSLVSKLSTSCERCAISGQGGEDDLGLWGRSCHWNHLCEGSCPFHGLHRQEDLSVERFQPKGSCWRAANTW